MNLGTAIKRRREELNISLDELANATNKSVPSIYRYENEASIPLDIFLVICDKLKITPNDLLSYTEYQNIVNSNEITDNNIEKIPVYNNILYDNQEVCFDNEYLASYIKICKDNINIDSKPIGIILPKYSNQLNSIYVIDTDFDVEYNKYYITYNTTKDELDCCKILKVEGNNDIFKNKNSEYSENLKIIGKVIISITRY